MIAWINFFSLIFVSLIFMVLYVRSVSPAAQEKIIGPGAYRRCYHLRVAASVAELLVVACFAIYCFFPLPTPLPDRFPWPWWFSVVVAGIIGVPALALMLIGLRDAGEEALRPKKEQALFKGIYRRLRHPQAAGEVWLFPVIAILLHSPFLALFSLVFFPIFLVLCYAEEQDLLLRHGETYAEYCRNTGAFWPRRHR